MASIDPPNLTVGTRVEVAGKGIRGRVAYIGTTGKQFINLIVSSIV